MQSLLRGRSRTCRGTRPRAPGVLRGNPCKFFARAARASPRGEIRRADRRGSRRFAPRAGLRSSLSVVLPQDLALAFDLPRAEVVLREVAVLDRATALLADPEGGAAVPADLRTLDLRITAEEDRDPGERVLVDRAVVEASE